jgi:cell division protein FtsB
MLSFRANRFELLVFCSCLCLLGFFAWHAWQGPRGYPYLAQLIVKQEKLAANHNAAKIVRQALETRVSLLRPESIDPDLVDELARQSLNMAKPNELIVHLKP